MTPKEKAKELFDKHFEFVEALSGANQIENAKKCALIAVNEIIENLVDLSNGEFTFISNVQYWQEVKQEIKKITL